MYFTSHQAISVADFGRRENYVKRFISSYLHNLFLKLRFVGRCSLVVPPPGCALVTRNTELSKKMYGIWNRCNLKSTGRIYTFGVLKYSEKFKVLDLP